MKKLLIALSMLAMTVPPVVAATLDSYDNLSEPSALDEYVLETSVGTRNILQSALDTYYATLFASLSHNHSGIYEPAGITESDISDLSHTVDTDAQTVDVFTLSGTTLSLSLIRDGAATYTIDLSGLGGSGDMSASTYDPASIIEQLVGLTAVQTLTNKTITAPSGIVTNDVVESTNKNYVTDAESVVVGNTSGTNTGDQDLSGKQDNITLTTTGTSGAATLVGATLNIPQYPGGSGGHTIQDEGTPLTARSNLNFIGGGVTAADDSANDATTITIAAGAAPVDSVNTQTGTVVLDADDISDTSTTNKFVTASDVTNLGNLTNTNSGDVTLAAGVNALTLSSQEIGVDATVEQLADLTPTNDALLGFNGSGDIENKTSISVDIVLADESSTTSGQITYDSTLDQIEVGDGSATDTFSNDTTNASSYEAELYNSAGLLAALSDETGTGVAVFGTSPAISAPAITGAGTIKISGEVQAVVNVITKAAAYTLGTDESTEVGGSLVIGTAAMALTLPTAAAGYSGCFMAGQGVTAIIQLTPATGDYLVVDGVRGTAATAYASDGSAGDKICYIAANADDWYITSEVGTWSE